MCVLYESICKRVSLNILSFPNNLAEKNCKQKKLNSCDFLLLIILTLLIDRKNLTGHLFYNEVA